ncbi:8506_t:CDS:2 [Funneliformis geosporum]|nr:8506_t:CDS:2 [Funneliformis geosporum]
MINFRVIITLETASEQNTSETITPVIIDIDQTPSSKGKEKEVEEIAETFNNIPFDVDETTITFVENTDFEKLAACNGIFVLNDMVRVHGCDLPKKDILAKSKFSAKLVGLPRFTTRKQLLDIGYIVNAIA